MFTPSHTIFATVKQQGIVDGIANRFRQRSILSRPRQDVDLDGVTLKKGDRVMAMIVAANLDAQANECPERLDLERRPNRHLSSGQGFTSASAISSHASKRFARCRRCSRAGPSSNWRSSHRKFAGGGGPAFAQSKSCSLWRGFDGSALILATDWKPIVGIEQERKKARAWG